ncbi:hypothetical protein [Rhodopirellula baltica]|uniref:hypothetical protein n=1 Tax=Rhodopirellula baltica TaxID=265606 RepID=UPI0011817C9C|nr:hypothetical protein [Rhodopirellula baltica]
MPFFFCSLGFQDTSRQTMDSANIESAKQAFLLTEPIQIRKSFSWLAEREFSHPLSERLIGFRQANAVLKALGKVVGVAADQHTTAQL